MFLGSSPVAVTSPSDFAPASSKEFLDIQATIECGFTLKRVHLLRIRVNYFLGKNNFINYRSKNYSLFQPLYYTLKRLCGNGKIVSWKSKNLSSERIVTPLLFMILLLLLLLLFSNK